MLELTEQPADFYEASKIEIHVEAATAAAPLDARRRERSGDWSTVWSARAQAIH